MSDKQKNTDQKILNVYCTAGYPRLDSTRLVMKALQDHGADMIELGMPYSDPLADGPVIQESNTCAIENGMTIPVMFEQLATMRTEIQIPVILMGYMNPVLQYGFEAFCAKAAEVGVSGLILPDMPPHEFEYVYQSILKKYRLNFTFLVTPETSDSRVRYLDQLSSGFLYAVSASAITGSNQSWDHVVAYLNRLKALNLHNPVLVGFGIKDKESFDRVAAHADGAIVGSAFIRALANSTNITADTARFLASIRPDLTKEKEAD
jgi:tryptophan synthase alpha chain